MTQKAPFGYELEWMLSRKKPMSVFYKALSERFDETGGQPFSACVANGKIEKSRFFIRNDGQSFTIMYTVYVLPEERWRVPIYKALKKTGQHIWCDAMGEIEEILLNSC